jgi:hypothetical protein
MVWPPDKILGCSYMSSKEVALQELRHAIANGVSGQYSCAHDDTTDLESWSRQAKELEQFAQSKGYWVRAHPTAQGNGALVDLIVLKI